jgi:M6 family metalloprotease-like protein
MEDDMRTISRALVAAATLVAMGTGTVTPGRADEFGASLSITGPTPIGDVTVVVPEEKAPVTGPLADWRPVPGLSGAIQSAASCNLAITVTAEMVGPAGAFVRARVDGQPVRTEPLFVAAGQARDDVRAFTFVLEKATAGQHTVEIEWKPQAAGAAPRMRDRSLTMRSAAAKGGKGRLAVSDAAATPPFDVSPGQYLTVPGTEAALTTAQDGPLAITFSGDVAVAGGRLFAQAVVDGAVVSDVLLSDATAAQRGARSYTFVTKDVGAGPHRVEVRARVEGGPAQVHARSVAVASAPASTADGGMVAVGVQTPPVTITSTSFVDVPSLAADVVTTVGASTLVIDAGAEVAVTGGRLFLRALVDGAPVRPAGVTFVQGEPKVRAESFAFALDNVTPGRHAVRIQASVDAGATASIADRFLRVHHARRSGAAFVQPYNAMRPKTRTFQTAVICFDPARAGHPKPTRAQLVEMFEGVGARGASLRGWFAENGAGRVSAGPVTYVGCDDAGWLPAPAGRGGTWYWTTGNFDQMWKDALTAADPSINFHVVDTDRDNRISPDELLVAIVRPQATPYGTTRATTIALDGAMPALDVHVSDLYLSANGAHRTGAVGLMAHEMSHSLLGTQDLYSPCPASTDARRFSNASDHTAATHLDPFHKLKSGLVAPDAIDIPAWTTRTLSLDAVERSREILLLYDPAKADREYFIVENRFGGSGATATYDQPIGDSVAVWHVIEDAATRNAFPTPAANPICRIPVRFVKSLVPADPSQDLVWANGTPAKIRIVLKSAPGATASVEVRKLP